MGATVSKSMLIRIWATKSLLTLITEALSALPTSHSRAQRALPSPHTEEAGRFLAPHSAPLPKPLPLSTHPAEHPVGHKPQASYRAGNRARTPTGGAARPLATSPRSGALKGKPAPGAPRLRVHPAGLGPETPASSAGDKLLQTPAAPSALRGSLQTAGTSGCPLPWSRAQHNPGQLCPSPEPLNPTQHLNLSPPSAAAGRLPNTLQLAPGAALPQAPTGGCGYPEH